MAQTNPYDVDTSRIEVTYAGFAEDFYCYRLHIADEGGMESCMFQMEVSQWLFDNAAPDEWHMGNDFPYPDHPAIKLHNYGKNDYFVLLKRFTDVMLFETQFPISGLTPTMLVP